MSDDPSKPFWRRLWDVFGFTLVIYLVFAVGLAVAAVAFVFVIGP